MEKTPETAAAGDEQQICRRNNGKRWKCKNLSADNNLQYCEKHYKFHTDFITSNPSILKNCNHLLLEYETPDLTKKEEEKKKTRKLLAPDEENLMIAPDEERCSRNDGVKWRCRNFRINSDTLKSKYCEKHYKSFTKQWNKKRLKKRSGDDSSSDIETRDSNCSKRRKRLREEDERIGEIQPSTTTNHTSSGRIGEGGSAKIGTKRKNVQRAEGSGELKSLIKTRKAVVELNSLEQYNNKCSEFSEELEKKKVELEKMNVECTKLRGELEETRKTAAKYEDATEFWRKKCSDLESLVIKMENEKSTMRCVEPRISNLESLVLRNGKESSISRCEELRNSEKIESKARGLQNEITQTGERQRDKNNMRKPNAETSSGGSKNSRVYGLKTKAKVLNVEEGKGWGGFEERPSQHGSSSQAHLEMSKKTFVNLVSDSDDGGDSLCESEDSDSSADSKASLGGLMDMLAMKYRKSNEDKEMKWKSEADMLSSFEEEPELCMKAVCALYRHHISEDEMSPKGLVIHSDTSRCITLAKFLMDEDCKGDVKKSVKELETLDSKAVEDCERLAKRYAVYLFDIYANGKDTFFRPATSASYGDQTANQ